MWLMSIWLPFASPAICTSICTSLAVQVCLLAGKSGLLLAYGRVYCIYVCIYIWPAASIPFNAARQLLSLLLLCPVCSWLYVNHTPCGTATAGHSQFDSQTSEAVRHFYDHIKGGRHKNNFCPI